MDKAPDAYRTISEVAEDLDLPQHVLRFWETRFTQIKPLKRGGGRRYYRPDDVELLKGIRHLLYKEGYTIKGVQRILKEQGVKAVQAFVRETLIPHLASPPAVSTPAPRAVVETHEPSRVDTWEPTLATAAVSDEMDRDDPEASTLQAASLSEPDAEPVHGAGRAAGLPREQAVARGQVSMFRGGLQRGEGTSSSDFQVSPLAELGNQMRARAEHPVADGKPGRNPDAPHDPNTLGARDALLLALEELVACRAAINQALARRQD
jgi:DNA-binding transcriptional MerR regulator